MSNHDRNAESLSNTTESDTGEQKDVVDNTDTANKSEEVLKEDDSNSSKVTIKGISNVTKPKSSNNISKVSTTVSKNSKTKPAEESTPSNEGVGSTEQGEVDEGAAYLDSSETLDWTFNTNIVKESYANVTIKVPNTVILTDGTEKEAEVIVKEKESAKEVPMTNNELSLAAGEYIYYYTCNNILFHIYHPVVDIIL